MNIEDGAPEIRVLRLHQPEPGKQDVVYDTPITNPTIGMATILKKNALETMIYGLRSTACADNVSPKYVTDSISQNTITMVMYMLKKKVAFSRPTQRSTRADERLEPTPIGFILARPDPEGVYIDIVCATSNGRDLLDYFFNYVKLVGYENITLSSLPNVLSYYPKLGFKFRASCRGPVLAELPDTIKYRDKKVKPFPKDWREAILDRDYSDFMLYLHSKGLSVNKSGECAKTDLPKSEFEEKECGADGFTMKRCGRDVAGLRSSTRYKTMGNHMMERKSRKSRKASKTRKNRKNRKTRTYRN